jgi:hypothetical protein
VIEAYFDRIKALVDQYAATGFVLDANVSFETRPGGQGYLGWLVGELVRTVRNDTSFREWVRRHELGLVLTQGKKERFGKAAIAVGGLIRGSVDKLVEGAAKGAGEAMGKAIVGGG